MKTIQARIKKSMLMVMMGLAVAMLSIAACGGANEATDESTDESGAAGLDVKRGGILKVTSFGTHTTLDPPFQVTQPDIIVTMHTYDNLVQIMPDMTLKPMLATS